MKMGSSIEKVTLRISFVVVLVLIAIRFGSSKAGKEAGGIDSDGRKFQEQKSDLITQEEKKARSSKSLRIDDFETKEKARLETLEAMSGDPRDIRELRINDDNFTFKEEIMAFLYLTQEEYQELNRIGGRAFEKIKALELAGAETLEETDEMVKVKVTSKPKRVSRIIEEFQLETEELIGQRKTKLLEGNFTSLRKNAVHDKIVSYQISRSGSESKFEFEVERFDKKGWTMGKSTRRSRIDELNPAFVSERYAHLIELN